MPSDIAVNEKNIAGRYLTGSNFKVMLHDSNTRGINIYAVALALIDNLGVAGYDFYPGLSRRVSH